MNYIVKTKGGILLNIKKREISGTFAGLASLVSRMSESDAMFQRVNSDYYASRSGFAGELKVDRFLEELELKLPYYIIQNLNLKVGRKEVQIDTIILHPNFVLVIEIKNMRGEFYFEPISNQFYRVNVAGEREGMRNPEVQLSRATNIVNAFFRSRGFDIVADGIIVFVSRAGIVMQPSQKWKTIPIDALVGVIEQLENQTKQLFSDESCKRLAFELLCENKIGESPSIVDYYNISPNKIKMGVRCPSCHDIPMEKRHSHWYCEKCGMKSRDAHLGTLQEYRLLFGSKITSEKANEFMQHDSIYYSIRVLNKNAQSENEKKRYRFFRIADERHLLSGFVQGELNKWQIKK